MFAEALEKRMALSVWHVGEMRQERSERIYDHGFVNGNLQSKILSEKRDIFEMPDYWRSAIFRGAFHFNHIETERLRPPNRTKRPQISRAGTEHDLFLGFIDSVITRNKGVGGPGLHLDKNQDVAIAANKIDFITPVARAAPISCYDLVTVLLAKKSCRQPLTLGAGLSSIRFAPRLPPSDEP